MPPLWIVAAWSRFGSRKLALTAGFLLVPELFIAGGQMQMDRGVIGLEVQGSLKVVDGFGVIPPSHQGMSEIELSLRMIGAPGKKGSVGVDSRL